VAIVTVSELAGGFGVGATVGNAGTAAADNVEWSIVLDGGFVLLGGETTGTIATLAPGATEEIGSSLILGVGKVSVTATAGSATTSGEGFVLGPLVLGLS
jgi:hypothetical protein